MGLEELSGAEAKALFFVSNSSSETKTKEKAAKAVTKEEEEGKKGKKGAEGEHEETLEVRLARLEAENAALRARVRSEGKAGDGDASSQSEEEEKKRKRKRKEKERKRKKKKDKEKKKAAAASASPLAPGTPLAAAKAASSSRPPPPPPSDFDVSAWKGYGLCPQLLAALAEARLSSPLPVQAATLPAALVARRDVLGAAPTGSGKTLAFGLAALQGLVDRGDVVPPPLFGEEEGGEGEEEKRGGGDSDDGGDRDTDEAPPPPPPPQQEDQQLARVLILCPTRELALQVSAALKPFGRAVGARVAPLVGGMSPQKQARLLAARPAVIVGTPGRLWDAMSAGIVDGGGNAGGGGSSRGKGARGSGSSSGAAASPYLQSSSPDASASALRGVRFLVVDEADRMAESGRFEELSNILGRVYGSVPRAALQTLVFSATLTLPQAQRGWLRAGKGGGGKGGAGLEELVEGLRLRPKPAVVDLCGGGGAKKKEEEEEQEREEEEEEAKEDEEGREVDDDDDDDADDDGKANANAKAKAKPAAGGTINSLPSLASGVSESYLELPDDEARDAALYSLLATTGGRALVFVNAVSAARRLAGLLRALRLPARSLHAGMQQRARLKSLDAFKRGGGGGGEDGEEGNRKGEAAASAAAPPTAATTVLVATDVAARGLDIPSVSLVVHYQVPPAADVYVHRCGRTARGVGGEGLALSLVTPRDSARFAALMRSLGRGGVGGVAASSTTSSRPLPPPYPLDRQLLAASAKRVRLASRVDVATRAAAKNSADDAWRRRLAAEAEIELSDDDGGEDGGGGGESDDGGGGGPSRKRHRNGLSAVDAAAAARLDVLLAQPLQPKFSSRFFAGAPAPSTIPSSGGGGGGGGGGAAAAEITGTAVAATVGLASKLAASRAAASSTAAAAANDKNNASKTPNNNNNKRKKPSAPLTVAELRAAALERALARRASGPKGRTSSSASATVGSRRRSALVVVNPSTTSLARGGGDALAVFRASQQQGK